MSDEKSNVTDPVAVEDPSVDVELTREVLDAHGGSGSSIKSMMDEQDKEAEQFALAFLKNVVRLRGVRIDRAHFLKAELRKRGFSTAEMDRAVAENPAAAGVSLSELDRMAENAIDFETRKSTALSFAAGLPGGFAMLGTVPADITQFSVHAFRVMQKIAYLYGWQSFLEDVEDVDDETLGKLAAFLGVMMGVGGASSSVGFFAVQVARPAVQKKVASVALTKTAWYLPMKQTLRIVGVHVTKQSFAKTVSKVVPVVGGVVSGGLTFVTLKTQSKRLMKHLRELPPPNVDAEEYLAAVRHADVELGKTEVVVEALGDVGSTVRAIVTGVAETFTPGAVVDKGLSDVSRAATKAKRVGGAITGRAGAVGGGVTGLFGSKRHQKSARESAQEEDL